MSDTVELQIRLKNKSFANLMLLEDILRHSKYVNGFTVHISEDLENNIQSDDITMRVSLPPDSDYGILKDYK